MTEFKIIVKVVINTFMILTRTRLPLNSICFVLLFVVFFFFFCGGKQTLKQGGVRCKKEEFK